MQLIADILKKLSDDGKITKKDLYELRESDVIDIINNSKYSEIFNIWRNAKSIKTSKTVPSDVYYVHEQVKIRYIDPLFQGKRISKVSIEARDDIENNLYYKMDNYVYLDFNI